MNKRKGVEMKFNFDKFRRSREDGNAGKKAKRPGLKSIIALSLSFVLMLSCSFAYFTDHLATSTTGTAGTVEVSLDDSGINLLNPDGQDILNPGDARPVVFTVTNDGNKSVDTEVVITLTSSEPMSNNEWNSLAGESLDLDDIINQNAWADQKLFEGAVYRSEYELYWADDIVAVDGYGYYPREWDSEEIYNEEYGDYLCFAKYHKIDDRYMNTARTQIKYVIDGDVLSGNMGLGEQEQEYVLKTQEEKRETEIIELPEDIYTVKYGDLSQYDASLGECYYIEINSSYLYDYIPESNASKILAIPNKQTVDGVEVNIDYIVSKGYDSLFYHIDGLYIGSNVKGYITVDTLVQDSYYYDQATIQSDDRYKVYDNYEDVFNSNSDSEQDGILKEVITASEYNTLSDAQKAKYELAPDSKTYNIVLLFDPNSSNRFQNSSVSIQVEVRAKQHRNTEAGWELIGEKVASSIDTSIFTVDNNAFDQVELTGVQEGVDLNTMTNVIIPEGVQVIPEEFFYYNEAIQSVTLPSTIEEIGAEAFCGCSSLTTINFPEGLMHIGERAFCASGLTTVDLPESLKSLGDGVFISSNKLTTVVIPDSVTRIGDSAFYHYLKQNLTVYTDSVLALNSDYGSRVVTFLPYADYNN